MDECCSRVSYVFGGMLTFLGLVLVVAFTVKYVHPYVQAREFSDDPAMCVVKDSEIVDNKATCTTTKGEMSTYPCLLIRAVYWNSNRTVVAIAFLDEIQLNFESNSCFYQMHTGGDCMLSRRENRNFVQKLERRYGNPGQKYECFPKTDNHTLVLIMKMRGYKVRDAMAGACAVLGTGLILISLTLWCQGKSNRPGNCCAPDEVEFSQYSREPLTDNNNTSNSVHPPPIRIIHERYEAETVL